MVQPGGDPSLPHRSVCGLLGGHLPEPGVHQQFLDGHHAVQPLVPAAPDHAHATGRHPLQLTGIGRPREHLCRSLPPPARLQTMLGHGPLRVTLPGLHAGGPPLASKRGPVRLIDAAIEGRPSMTRRKLRASQTRGCLSGRCLRSLVFPAGMSNETLLLPGESELACLLPLPRGRPAR